MTTNRKTINNQYCNKKSQIKLFLHVLKLIKSFMYYLPILLVIIHNNTSACI